MRLCALNRSAAESVLAGSVAPHTVISGILLAAGAARRFGGGKLLHRLADGTPIGLASLRNLQAALPRIVVVVRPDDQAVARLYADAGAQTIVCLEADLGMGHSLAAGVAHEAQAQGWIVALADMPNLLPQTIHLVGATLSERGGIVVPVFQSQRGHPVGFSEAFREELLALRGDSGARAIVQAHPHETYRLPVDDPGIVQDVDTPDDLQRLRVG
jgi:molybdenum cofactor cytidylyltransferase